MLMIMIMMIMIIMMMKIIVSNGVLVSYWGKKPDMQGKIQMLTLI